MCKQSSDSVMGLAWRREKRCLVQSLGAGFLTRGATDLAVCSRLGATGRAASLHCTCAKGGGGGGVRGVTPTACDAPGDGHVHHCKYTHVQVAHSSWLCSLASSLAARKTWCRMLPQLPAQPSSCSLCSPRLPSCGADMRAGPWQAPPELMVRPLEVARRMRAHEIAKAVDGSWWCSEMPLPMCAGSHAKAPTLPHVATACQAVTQCCIVCSAV